MSSHAYKNQPKGMGSLSTNIHRSTKAFNLDDLLIFGNRTQRRFAKKQIEVLHKNKGKNHGC